MLDVGIVDQNIVGVGFFDQCVVFIVFGYVGLDIVYFDVMFFGQFFGQCVIFGCIGKIVQDQICFGFCQFDRYVKIDFGI